VDFEVDGADGAASLSTLLDRSSIDSLGWQSDRRPHLLFAADGKRLLDALANAGAHEGKEHKVGAYHLESFPDLEIRVGGYKLDGITVKQVQSVCPPSFGTSGEPRKWNGFWTIAELPESVYASLERLSNERHRTCENGDSPGPKDGLKAKLTSQAERYTRAALEKATSAVSGAPPGTRHDVLRQESLAVASLVKAGALSASD
jgi:hypothetical protein